MKVTTLKIRTCVDPRLREMSVPLGEVGPSERIFIDAMIKTMYESDGVGLAAPQVGVNKRFFVAEMGEGPIVVINPVILEKSGSSVMEEGCLSVPGVVVNISRPDKILVEYQDENNETSRRELSGLSAKIFQHEYDHLDGKLIFDYAEGEEKQKIIEQLKKIET